MKSSNLILMMLTALFTAMFFLPLVECGLFTEKWTLMWVFPGCYFAGAVVKHLIFRKNRRTPNYRWNWKVELCELAVLWVVVGLVI